MAYALIQVAALAGDTATVLYVSQICEEFRTRAFALHLADDSRVELDYAPTAQTLGLPPGEYTLRLDRDNPMVQSLLHNFPGFWLDNPTLAHVMARMVASGDLQAAHFVSAGRQILTSADAPRLKSEQLALLQRLAHEEALNSEETQAVAQLLAKPRFAKYLIALIQTHGEFARRIGAEVADGPYSSTVEPQPYRQSVLRLLQAACAMYTSAGQS